MIIDTLLINISERIRFTEKESGEQN
jgi:hypothetical protein